MAATHTEPACIVNGSPEELFLRTCSLDESNGEWEELEQFWGEEKCRERRSSVSMSSSLEKHLMYDDYLEEPLPKHFEESYEIGNEFLMVNGVDIKDVPTIYRANGFQPHELIVIGTYIDKNVIPGFQYKVRKNLTEDYLFEGRAVTLESIGMGYGKRLTFEGKRLNDNLNYFWSDSHAAGYGLTPQAISPDSIFRIIDTSIKSDVGRITVNDPARTVDLELQTSVQDNGKIEKTIKVHFSGDVILSNSCNRMNIFMEDMEVQGLAKVQRVDQNSKEKINEIVLENFLMDNCILVPEE